MSIISGNITVNGIEQIEELLELEIEEQPSKHPKARFRAGIEYGADLIKFHGYQQDKIIQIYGKDQDTEQVSKLFAGYIEELQVHDVGAGYYELEVRLLGASCKMDQDKRNRSFQDVSMTHEGVAKKAAGSTKGARVVWNGTAAKAIGMPVIQYAETDWEFILRLASIYRCSVFANASADYPILSVGMELTDSSVKLGNTFYRVGVSERFYELGGKRAGLVKSNFQYYQITVREPVGIGQIVSFQGKKLVVCEKTTRLTESEIKYTYRLSTPSYGSSQTIYNGTFIGHTILGKVLETKGETLKLDLELSDDEHNDSVAYPYKWTPETGNIMYCMPKVGTRVSLYFGDEVESSGTVVNCIRENGGSCAKMDNPKEKHFTSEDGLLMDLDLEDMHFGTAADKAGDEFSMFYLLDDNSITFETAGSINILAQESIEIKAKFAMFGAAKGEVTLAGNAKGSASTFYMHYQFDILGEKTGLQAWDFGSWPKINDEPLVGVVPKKPDGWGIFGKFMAGMAAVVLATAAVCLVATGVGAGAGVVLGMAAAGVVSGAFAVGSMAIDELNGGESKSIWQYMGNGAFQASVAAISSAVGGGLSTFATKAGLELGTTAVSTIGENLIKGNDKFEDLGVNLLLSLFTFGLFEGIPALKNSADVLGNSQSRVDMLGTQAKAAKTSAKTAKEAAQTAGEVAETAAREEVEAASREAAARRAERCAEQTRNRLRNNRASAASRRDAQNALNSAKAARRTAVAEHAASTAAKNSADQAAVSTAARATAKAQASAAANVSLKREGGNYFVRQLGYEFGKATIGKVEEKTLKPFLKEPKQYISVWFDGINTWAEE